MNTTTTGTITQAFCPIKGIFCANSNGNGCALTAPPCIQGNPSRLLINGVNPWELKEPKGE